MAKIAEGRRAIAAERVLRAENEQLHVQLAEAKDRIAALETELAKAPRRAAKS